MRKAAFLLLVFCIGAQTSFAKHLIVFYADFGQIDHPLQNDPSKEGHTFVSFLREDPVNKQTIVDCRGFNPKNPDELGWISYVEGEVMNDIARQRDIGFMIEVTEAELLACTKTKDLWANRLPTLQIRKLWQFNSTEIDFIFRFL